jgi:nuclear pore complex protein Nup93
MQSKMMVYDRVISDLNAARLRGTSYPIVHALIEASLSLNTDVSSSPLCQILFYNVL